MSIKFSDNSKAVKEELKKAGIAWLHEACGEVESQTKKNSAVLTGKTKGSYLYRINEDAMEGYIGTDYENAIWEEYGTGEYALDGNGRKGGWFYKGADGKGHFTRGKKPRRPLFKAYTSLKSRLKKSAQDIYRGLGK